MNKIMDLIENQEEYCKRNTKLRNHYIANYGHSGEATGKYIIDSLKKG